MIIDTSVIIDACRNDSAALKKLKEIENTGEGIIASPALFELFSGIARSSRSENEKNKVMGILQEYPIASLDSKAAGKAGLIDGQLAKQGNSIGIIDTLIAGIAITQGMAVLTKNKKHFSRIEGIKIESY